MLLKVLACLLAIGAAHAAIVDPNQDNSGTQRPTGIAITTTRTTGPPPICSYNGYWLNCSNFNSFSQLNFGALNYQAQELLIIAPPTPLDLDETFDLTGYNTKYSSIRFSNIKSFPFLADQTKNIKSGKSLYIKGSEVSFKTEDKLLSSQCDASLLEKIDVDHVPFFSAFKQLSFEDGNTINEPLCPLLFKGANLSYFSSKSPLKFIQMKDVTDLDVSVEGFDISGCTYSLDTESFSPLVLKSIRSWRTYEGNIVDVQEDFFKYFPLLKYMRVHLNNLGDFFRNVNPAWMKNANYLIDVDFTDAAQVQNNRNNDLLITLKDESATYTFPDEDFCIFKDFPHHKMLFFQIDTAAKLECTCTLYWLHKHKKYKSVDFTLEATRRCFTADKFDKAIEACKFEERLAECRKPVAQTTTEQPLITTVETTTTSTRPPTYIPTTPRSTTYIPTTPRPVPTIPNAINRPGLLQIICNNCYNISVVNKA